MNAPLLPAHKTKIVATIGPASESPEMLVRLIRAGMNVARLNFSHGSPSKHAEVIRRIRDAARETGRRVAIMADLPGPKLRLGKIDPEPIQLLLGAHFTLTSEDIVGNAQRASTTFQQLPRVVKPGDRIFLNDGLVQLVVDRVAGNDVECTVAVGGELRSRKGLNLPGIDLGISAFTENDRACLEFALKEGVDAVSQSFVERAADIEAVRTAAAKIGAQPFIIAKIERADALAHFDEILAAADGIMVARGDLGVEVPIEEIAYTQKQLIAKSNLAGKPVITATQMLESMVLSRLPTRAEATDVANAILDGTDCVMLSGESAVGKFPEEAVTMLAKIAAFTETHRPPRSFAIQREFVQRKASTIGSDRMASLVEHALYTVPCDLVLVPTRGGNSRARHFAFQTAGVDHRAECRLRCVSESRVLLRRVSDQSRRGTGRLARMDCGLAARKRNHRRTGHACRRPIAAKPESQLSDRANAPGRAEWVNAKRHLNKTKVQQASFA